MKIALYKSQNRFTVRSFPSAFLCTQHNAGCQDWRCHREARRGGRRRSLGDSPDEQITAPLLGRSCMCQEPKRLSWWAITLVKLVNEWHSRRPSAWKLSLLTIGSWRLLKVFTTEIEVQTCVTSRCLGERNKCIIWGLPVPPTQRLIRMLKDPEGFKSLKNEFTCVIAFHHCFITGLYHSFSHTSTCFFQLSTFDLH